MALTWPSDIIPSGMSDPEPIRLRAEQIAPNQTMQMKASATCLYQVTFQFPPLTRLQMEKVRAVAHKFGTDTVTIPLLKPFETNQTSGTILAAAGANGASLPVTGVNSAYAPKAGQFISVQTGGYWRLYILYVDSAAGSTSRTFTLANPLRAIPSVGDSVSLEPAYIQGNATLSIPSNGADSNGYWQGVSLTVREIK